MNKPRVAIGSLGGTISMTPPDRGGGAVPTLGAEQLAASVPGLAEVAELTAESLLQLPSASLTMEHLGRCLDWANAQVDAGAAGVVLTQGTDTIEESAYFLDLYWKRDEPLIVTGAMRTPRVAGADGPANLLAAVRTVIEPNSRSRGVLVVMNDTIHSARWVRKSDALSVETFASGDIGVQGRVVEGVPNYFQRPPTRLLAPAAKRPFPKIALLAAAMGDDGDLADAAVAAGYEGIVVSAFGAGHVSAAFADRIERLSRQVPVLIATRTGGGRTATHTYGFAGSEIDLVRRGALLCEWLSPVKARLVLGSLLASGCAREDFAEWVSRWGKVCV